MIYIQKCGCKVKIISERKHFQLILFYIYKFLCSRISWLCQIEVAIIFFRVKDPILIL